MIYGAGGATKLATAVREKDVLSREIIQAHLDRIDRVNGTVNAITVIFADEALEAADAVDAAVASGDDLGPLHGVPITVKENIDVRGSATTTNGVVSRKDSFPGHDAPVIRHLKSAGAIIIGRTPTCRISVCVGIRITTCMVQLSIRGTHYTHPADRAEERGVALATGMSPLGIGNDMGGSTRQPAINCGCFRLAPEHGSGVWRHVIDLQ